MAQPTTIQGRLPNFDLWLITSKPQAQEMMWEHRRGLSIPQMTAERFALMINNGVDRPSSKERYFP
jgi:PhoPQ-activated pathogenicity-related protein